MNRWLAHKYLMLVSSQLSHFQQSRDGVWRCRCPYCGDSKKSESKTRGYFFWHDDVLTFKCHNCGTSTSFQNFLKEQDPTLYKEAMLEMFGKQEDVPIVKTDTRKLNKRLSSVLVGYNRVSTSPYADYLSGRKIPIGMLGEFVEIPSLREFAGKFEAYKHKRFPDVKCIGIPFRVGDTVSFVQCRTIEPCDIRYITFEVDGGPKLFGYNHIDKSQIVSVLEGPFDSCFVRNAVANAGAADHTNTDYLLKQGCQLRFIFDRDYATNSQVRKQLDERIAQGHLVVIYDKNFTYKDINDAILDGWSADMINSYLDSRTFKGLKAKLELSRIAR